MLVLGEFGMSCKLGRVLSIGFACLKVALPIVVQSLEHPLRDFCRKGLVGLMRLHQLVHLLVVEVLPLKNEGLTHNVKCSIIQILRGKRSCINHCKAWVCSCNHMLLG